MRSLVAVRATYRAPDSSSPPPPRKCCPCPWSHQDVVIGRPRRSFDLEQGKEMLRAIVSSDSTDAPGAVRSVVSRGQKNITDRLWFFQQIRDMLKLTTDDKETTRLRETHKQLSDGCCFGPLKIGPLERLYRWRSGQKMVGILGAIGSVLLVYLTAMQIRMNYEKP